MISVQALRAHAGAFTLDDISFDVPSRAYGVVIGPTGSGKTTLLETISGIIPAAAGRVMLNDRDATAEPADMRRIGLVYQLGFLFPHLSVEQNVMYGAADRAMAATLARRFGVDALYSRSVRSLSGGERQLVAIVRALARHPETLLLDEPFSALDPRRRAAARREVRAIHEEWGLTTLHVTHDFAEAGSVGDVAILLDGGRVLQTGEPAEVFRHPANSYVAEFLGAENIFAGGVSTEQGETVFHSGPLTIHVAETATPGPAHAIVRAGEILVSREAPGPSSARNQFEGTLTEIAATGPLWRITIDVNGVTLVAALTSYSMQEFAFRAGDTVFFTFKATAVHIC